MRKLPCGRLVLGRSLLGILLGLSCGPAVFGQKTDSETRFEVGLTHLREGRVDLAIEEFTKAVKADPKNPYFRKGLGHALASKRRFNDAILEYRKALELNPFYTDVRNDLGTALVLGGRREEGKKEFLAAYSDPTNPTPELSARNLGLAYLEEKDHKQAAEWFRVAITRNKEYAECYVLLAESLKALGRADEALAQLETGLRKAPTDPAILVALGDALFAAGRFSEARTHLEAAAKADPSGASGRRATEILRNLPR